LRLLGQEDLARARDLHQLGALAGHRLLEHPAEPARARVLELDVALIGDHRAGLRLDGDLVELDLEQFRVLKRERVGGLDFVELSEGGLHGAFRIGVAGPPETTRPEAAPKAAAARPEPEPAGPTAASRPAERRPAPA